MRPADAVLHVPRPEYVGITIDLRVAGNFENAMRIQREAWDDFVAQIQESIDSSIAEKKVEVRIINMDGSIKDITFAELKPLVIY